MSELRAAEATIGGQASRISAADKVTPEQGSALLQAQGGTLTAQISITRKATGKVEHYTLTASDQPKEA